MASNLVLHTHNMQPNMLVNAERTAPCHISRASTPGQPGAPLQARTAARLEQDQEAPYAAPTLTPDRGRAP